jgi:hypothetical protein
MLLNSEIANAGALVFLLAGAVVQRRFGKTHAADRGRRTCADGQWGFPRNLGDPVVSVLNRGSEGGAAPKPPGPETVPGLGGETKPPAPKDGIANRRKRRAARRTSGSRSALVVPSKRGNGSRPDCVEGSEASDHGPVEGKHNECVEIRILCH